MKTLFTLSFILVCISNIFSQNSNLILFSEQGEQFFLYINGVKQNLNPETNVKVTDLNADSYKLRIVFHGQDIPQLNKNIYFATKGNENTFSIKLNRKDKYVMRFVSETPLSQAPQNVSNQTIVVYSAVPVIDTTTISSTNTTTTQAVTTQSNVTTTQGDISEGVSMNVNLNNMGMNVDVNINDSGIDGGNTTMTQSSTTTTSSTITTNTTNSAPVQNNSTIVYVQGYTGVIGCPTPMLNSEFQTAKNSISSKDFEDSKLTVAKQIVNTNCLTAQQVKEITMLFDFESTKLEFAKYCYHKTYDLGNYYKVNDAFEFEMTIDELNEYINAQ